MATFIRDATGKIRSVVLLDQDERSVTFKVLNQATRKALTTQTGTGLFVKGKVSTRLVLPGVVLEPNKDIQFKKHPSSSDQS